MPHMLPPKRTESETEMRFRAEPEGGRVPSGADLRRIPFVRSCHGRKRFLLPRCYQTIPNHADPSRMASVPSVEIFEFYSVLVLGGNAPWITLNQRVQGSSP